MQGKVGAVIARLGLGLLAIALFGAAGANAVTDTARPSLTLPAAATTNATSSRGATIFFSAVATDDVQPTSLVCAPGSGAQFPVGITTVTCTATDAASHSTSATFAISVLAASDQLALLRAAVIALHLDPSVQQGLVDKLDSAKGSILASQSTIACNQLNAFANQVKAQTKKAIADGTSLLNGQYEIEAALDCVQSKAAPVVLGPSADVTTNTAPGSATATVRYTGPACTPSSPAALGIGTTRIRCQATNPNGTTNRSFNVTVLDREAPVLSVPSDIAATAPAGSSTAVVTFTATVTDNVAVSSTVCTPASGSAFAHGTTTVSCVATDTSGNTATGSFRVTVNFAISGRITDADTGLPLAGVRAAVFDSVTGERLDLTVSDADGRYSIAVPPGTYRVRFNGNRAVPYEIQLWNGKADNQLGDVISVTGSVGSIDAALKRVSFIRGHVARQDGTPIEGVFVNANDGLAGCCHFITGSRTNADGDFAIPVGPGTYKVLFFSRPGFLASDGVTYLDQWWNAAPFFEQGSPVVISGSDVGGINAVMVRAVVVSGHVTDASGLPVAGFQVNALDASVPCCQFVGGAQTDSHGDYGIAVPPGLTLKVDFGVFSGPPPGTRFVPQWWNNKASFDAADAIQAAADVPNVNARLANGFLITGHVSERGSGAALAGMHVQVFDFAVPCCPFRQMAQTETSATGDYAVVVAAGSYKVQFSEYPPPAVRPHLSQWWQDKPFDQGADLLVAAGDRTGIDETLPVGVFISGSVTAAGGTIPVVGLNVSAQDASQPCCHFVGGAQTDASGNYRFPVAAGSSVKVEFGVFSGPPPGTRYLGQWWDNKTDFGAANTISALTDVSGINADLASGFVLSGHVTDASGTVPLGTIGVNANDATLSCCQFIVGTQTDSAGNYRLIVPAGRVIRVFFSTNPAGGVRYLPEWWDDKPFFDQATDIAMTADRPGVDARLASGVLIHGRVTDYTGTLPVAGLRVSAQDATQFCCHFVGGSQTDTDGQYTMVVPSGPDVKIEFGVFSGPPPGTRYLGEWWNNAPTFDTATAISTTSDHNNIDASLEQGFAISGMVRAPGGSGVPNVFVGASLGGTADCCIGVGGTGTDPTGHYRLVLRAGAYRINVSAPPDRRVVSQWWAGVPGGTAYFQRAPDIALGPTDANDRDFDVVFGTLIQGHVSDATNSAAIPGVGVTANDAGIACCEGLAFTGTDQQGNYFLVVPSGRQVRVFFSVGPGSPYNPQWWNNKADFGTADLIDTGRDQPAIDAVLAPIDSSPAGSSVPPTDGTPSANSGAPTDGTSGASGSVADDRAIAVELTPHSFIAA